MYPVCFLRQLSQVSLSGQSPEFHAARFTCWFWKESEIDRHGIDCYHMLPGLSMFYPKQPKSKVQNVVLFHPPRHDVPTTWVTALRALRALRWCESCRYSQWLGSVHNIASLLSATVPYPSYSIIPAIFNQHDRQISTVYSWVLKHASIPERSSDHSADYCAATGAQALVVLSSAGKCCMHWPWTIMDFVRDSLWFIDVFSHGKSALWCSQHLSADLTLKASKTKRKLSQKPGRSWLGRGVAVKAMIGTETDVAMPHWHSWF